MELTHWPEGCGSNLINYDFQTPNTELELEPSLQNCTHVNAREPQQWEVNMGSRIGAVRQQAITCTNVDLDLMTSLGLNESKLRGESKHLQWRRAQVISPEAFFTSSICGRLWNSVSAHISGLYLPWHSYMAYMTTCKDRTWNAVVFPEIYTCDL